MEMATHGLALQLMEMSRLERINRTECEIMSDEDRLIKSWTSKQIFSKLDYFRLTRKTLLFVLNQSSMRELKKKDLLKGISIYFNEYSNELRNYDIRKPLIDVIVDPWKNTAFSWEELFQKRITIREKKVQEYFCSEPEEIVMARVHWFMLTGKEDMAMTLAKNSVFFHTRIAKSLFISSENQNLNQTPNLKLPSSKIRKGTASMDWYLTILQRKKSLSAVFNEVKQLTCHEGIILVQRARRCKKTKNFAFSILQILFMQELIRPSKFCCTKKIFYLWSVMHKERKTPLDSIHLEIQKMLALYAPSSAHFYLLVDTLWEQFGSSATSLYVELYIRGLTSDFNHLEAARNGETQDDVFYLESHIASMFSKLSTLFSDFHEGAARECMFSAFSLKPTKERLYILQSLTHSILSTENEMKLNSPSQNLKENFLEHPILMKGISSVPYSVVKDLVSVLESVRCIQFQYNQFNWHNNAIDLGDYLKDFNNSRSWESDTEYASDGSIKSDDDNPAVTESLYSSAKINVENIHVSSKRKSELIDPSNKFLGDAGPNVEIRNGDNIFKKIKLEDQNREVEINNQGILDVHMKSTESFNNLGMEDAIENVIRIALSGRQKSNLSLDNNSNTFLNSSIDHSNDNTQNLNLLSTIKHMSENYMYPYSLTSYGKQTDLNTNLKVAEYRAVKSEAECSKYLSASPSTPSQRHASGISRESVISPLGKNNCLDSMRDQIHRQMAQSNLPSKTADICQNSIKNPVTSTLDTSKGIPVYKNPPNSDYKNVSYEKVRKVSSAFRHNSPLISNQTAVQVHNKSDIIPTEFSEEQFLSKSSAASSSSITPPVNFVQAKGKVEMYPSSYSPLTQVTKSSSVFKTGSRYQIDNNNLSKATVKKVDQSICFEDNQLVHCDRSSVIQHTMQLNRDLSQNKSNDVEIPNRLAVSVNSNAAEQIRSVPKKDLSNLPPFTVNVADRVISNAHVAVPANFVIARKSQPQTETSSQSQLVCSNTAVAKNTDTITISGILASPSVIVSPSWETQMKKHGELMYKKNANVVNTLAIDKRIYKKKIPYGRPIYLTSGPKITLPNVTSNKNINSEVSKAIASPSNTKTNYRTCSPQNQNDVTSSQPWYSEPYPKSFPTGNKMPSKTSEALNVPPKQKAPIGKTLQPTKYSSEIKTYSLHAKQVQSSNNRAVITPSVVTTLSPAFNNSVPGFSTKSSVLNSNIVSSTDSSVSQVKNRISKAQLQTSSDFLSNHVVNLKSYTTNSNSEKSNAGQLEHIPSLSDFHSNNMTNLKTYANISNSSKKITSQLEQLLSSSVCQGNNMVNFEKNTKFYPAKNLGLSKNNSNFTGHPSDKIQQNTNLILENNNVYKASDVTDSHRHYSHVSPTDFSSACCSPSEVNPCQSCSLPAENKVSLSSNETNIDGQADYPFPSSDKMIPTNDLSQDPCSTNISSNNSEVDNFGSTNSNAVIVNCEYCSLSFEETKIQMHILSCHSQDLNIKNHIPSEVHSDLMMAGSFPIKSLPEIVPEQNSFFQKESLNDDLPHSKAFINSIENIENDKNLDEANAFNACMDLFNDDLVQGFDPIDQIDNNYLQLIPSADPTSIFLNSNLCEDIKKDISIGPSQTSAISNNIDDFKHYAVDYNQLPYQVNELDNVFDFTEKEYESAKSAQNFIQSPQTSCTEKISVNTSNISNELSFSTMTELIKATLTEGCQSEIESVNPSVDENTKDPILHILENPKKKQPKVYSCPYCSKELCSNESVKRHIKKLHPNINTNNSQNMSSNITHLSTSIHENDCNVQFINSANTENRNSCNDNSNSINYTLISDTHQNSVLSNTQVVINEVCQNELKSVNPNPDPESKRLVLYGCPHCSKKYRSAASIKRHIKKLHPDVHANNSGNMSLKCTDLSSSYKFEKNVKSESGNSNDKNSINYTLVSDINQNSALSNIPSTIKKEYQNESILIKNEDPDISEKPKEILHKLESPLTIQPIKLKCPYCPKKLCSDVSVNRHIMRVHQKNNSGKVSPKFTNSSFPTHKSDYDVQLENNANSNIGNSCNNNSMNYPLVSEINQNSSVSNSQVATNGSCQNGQESMNTNIIDRQRKIPHENPQTTEPIPFSCPHCSKQLRSEVSVNRHIMKVHQKNKLGEVSAKFTDLSFPNYKSSCSVPAENNADYESSNFCKDSGSSIDCTTFPDVNQNSTPSDMFEEEMLPKSKNIELTKTECKFCGKYLNAIYLKKHILTQHKDMTLNLENSSSDFNAHIHVNPQSQVDMGSNTTIPSLLEQDIDSNTCLSVSDALKKNSYIVTENSESNSKLVENKGIQFDFNVLDITKSSKVDSKTPISNESAPSKSVENAYKDIGYFEKNYLQNYSGHEKQNKLTRYPCNLCSKSYVNMGALNRHLRLGHKIEIMKTPKKSKMEHQLKEGVNDKTIESEYETFSGSPMDNTFAKPVDNANSVKRSQYDKLSCNVANVQMREKSRTNINKSLLKQVLKSNFVSKQYEKRDCSELNKIASSNKGTVIDSQLNVCDTSKYSENVQKSCSPELNLTDVSPVNKNLESSSIAMCDSGFKPAISEVVPFENMPNSENQSCYFMRDTETNCQSDLAIQHIQNKMPEISTNIEIKHSGLADSENLSAQSNEISPISEIISNVSKCHFGEASNPGDDKEIFEDNSLKLLIPVNGDDCTNEIKSAAFDSSSAQEDFQQIKERSLSAVSDASSKTFSRLNSANMNKKRKISVNELSDVESISHNADKSSVRCRLCHQDLDSMEILSKHLKEIHDIPVLKKHISEPCFSDKLKYSKKLEKLSPPKLKMGPNESDSDSVSDLDNPNNLSEPVNEVLDVSKDVLFNSSELDSSKGEMCYSSELGLSKEEMFNSSVSNLDNPHNLSEPVNSVLDASKDVLFNSSELDSFKGEMCYSSELGSSKEEMFNSSVSNLDNPHNLSEPVNSGFDMMKDVLCNSSELDSSKGKINNSSGLDSPKEEICNFSELDSSEKEIPNSSEIESSQAEEYSFSKSESPKKSMSSFENLSQEIQCASELDFCKEFQCSSELNSSKKLQYVSELNTFKESCCDSPISSMCKDTVSSEIARSKNMFFKEDLCNFLPTLSKQHEEKVSTVNSLTVVIKEPLNQFAIKSAENNNSLTFDHNLEHQSEPFLPSKHKKELRRHSFCLSSLKLNEKCTPTIHNKNVDFDVQNIFCKLKRSFSLPNLKIQFHLLPTHKIDDEIISMEPSPKKRIPIETSSDEHTLLSSVTDQSEVFRSSCSSSSAASSFHNSPPEKWDNASIDSNLTLPTTLFNACVPKREHKTFLRSKFEGKKLIIQRCKTSKLKKYKKSKNSYVQKKLKPGKTYKPTILSLKASTEITDFLSTHKQPIVKLVRLKDDCLLNQNEDTVSDLMCNKYSMKEAVVKLERMHIPCDKKSTALIDQKFHSNLFSQNSHYVTMQNHLNKNGKCPPDSLVSSDADISSEISNPGSDPEITTLGSSDSNDSGNSVQFVVSLTKREKALMKRKRKKKDSAKPDTKECCVVLNRIPL